MTRSGSVLAAMVGCTPVWPGDGVAPSGQAPWGYPTDDVCLELADPDAFEVDGFLFCATDAQLRITAVDDPVMSPCTDVPATQEGLVYSVFDGGRAQAFPIALLQQREVVHVSWGTEALLVDY